MFEHSLGQLVQWLRSPQSSQSEPSSHLAGAGRPFEYEMIPLLFAPSSHLPLLCGNLALHVFWQREGGGKGGLGGEGGGGGEGGRFGLGGKRGGV
eukprot:jgi/Chrpa1/16229/Chrysochromulina_OHIO_Genome00025060-RA